MISKNLAKNKIVNYFAILAYSLRTCDTGLFFFVSQ